MTPPIGRTIHVNTPGDTDCRAAMVTAPQRGDMIRVAVFDPYNMTNPIHNADLYDDRRNWHERWACPRLVGNGAVERSEAW